MDTIYFQVTALAHDNKSEKFGHVSWACSKLSQLGGGRASGWKVGERMSRRGRCVCVRAIATSLNTIPSLNTHTHTHVARSIVTWQVGLAHCQGCKVCHWWRRNFYHPLSKWLDCVALEWSPLYLLSSMSVLCMRECFAETRIQKRIALSSSLLYKASSCRYWCV